MSARLAGQIADAVLYEGYVLYPYRASAAKNRSRWLIGLVTPREYAEASGSDPWFMQTECLAEIERGGALTVNVRALHVQERSIEQPVTDGAEDWHAVESLMVDGRQLITWDEAVMCEFNEERVPLDGARQDSCFPWVLDALESCEVVHGRHGTPAARIVRRRRPVVGSVRIQTEPCGQMLKVRVRLENLTPCAARALGHRDAAVRQSLAGAHAVLALDRGAFVSLLDPPPPAAALAAACVNVHTFPVLVGPQGSRGVMLSSPVILYDYPVVAPESAGDLCDATEIDEMLTLRVRTMTEDEKREARATDARAAEIVDRCEAASATALGQLHGAVRRRADVRDFESFLNPPDELPPEAASLDIDGMRIGRGSRVRLEPTHRADSIDICLRGRTATVTAVYRTLEDKPYVTVTLDGDPFGASGARYRRSLFFHPDEIVPLETPTGGAT